MAKRRKKAGAYRYDTTLDPNLKLVGAVFVKGGCWRPDAGVPLPPGADLRRYEEDLFSLIRRTFDKTFGDRIAQRIPKLYASSERIKALERSDDAFSELAAAPSGAEAEIEILEELNKLRNVTAKKLDGGRFETNVEEIFKGASTVNGQALRRQFATILAVNPVVSSVSTQTALEHRMKVTVAKVKSIASSHHDELAAMILDAHVKGVNSKALGKMISERYGVTLGKGKFVASNELGNLNAELAQIRQEENGVEQYRWRTSLDEVVRPTHASKEGQVFDWDNPPADTGHPGQDFRCRCTPEPVLNDLDDLDEPIEPEPEPTPDPFVEPELEDPTPPPPVVVEPPPVDPYDAAIAAWDKPAFHAFPPNHPINEGWVTNFLDQAGRIPRVMGEPLHDRTFTMLLPDGKTVRVLFSKVDVDLPDGTSFTTFTMEGLDRHDSRLMLGVPGLDDAQRLKLKAKIDATPGIDPALRFAYDERPFSEQLKEFIDLHSTVPVQMERFDLSTDMIPNIWGGFNGGEVTKARLIGWLEAEGGTPADVIAAIAAGERAPKLVRKPNRKFFDAHSEVTDIVAARQKWERANTGKPFLDKVDDWLLQKKELAVIDERLWELRDEETVLFDALESLKAQGAPVLEKRAAVTALRRKKGEILRGEASLIELQGEVYGPNRSRIDEMARELEAYRDELAQAVENPEQWNGETGAWRNGSTNRITRGGPTWNAVWDETATIAPASRDPGQLTASVNEATENMGKWFGDSNAQRGAPIRFTKTDDRAYQSGGTNRHTYINTGYFRFSNPETPFQRTASVQMHEMGHLMEDRNPSLEEGAKRYLLGLAEQRPGGISTTEMASKIYTSRREVYIENVFYQKYAAKVYKHGGQSPTTSISRLTVDNLHATEVSSMAVQEWNDPNAMLIQYETEPNLFWWAVMMMRGDIKQ